MNSDHVVGSRVAGLGAASVVDVARIHQALLSLGREDLDISRGVLQSLHHLHHVRPRVLLRTVHTAQLQVRPVDEVAVDGDSERIDSR